MMQSRVLKRVEVLRTRNLCIHPGDMQKFKAVEEGDLVHLVDPTVFATRGKRPATDMMSGGNLNSNIRKNSIPESCFWEFYSAYFRIGTLCLLGQRFDTRQTLGACRVPWW